MFCPFDKSIYCNKVYECELSECQQVKQAPHGEAKTIYVDCIGVESVQSPSVCIDCQD